jgi:hypothetical protein
MSNSATWHKVGIALAAAVFGFIAGCGLSYFFTPENVLFNHSTPVFGLVAGLVMAGAVILSDQPRRR